MIKEDFEKLVYFTYDEKDLYGNYIFHDPEILKHTSLKLMLILDKIREKFGYPIIIHCTYETSGHTKHSWHYKGKACDFHFLCDFPYKDQVDILLNILKVLKLENKVGLGLYPDWEHKGFHLDVRGSKARWGRKKDIYVSFDKILKYINNK